MNDPRLEKLRSLMREARSLLAKLKAEEQEALDALLGTVGCYNEASAGFTPEEQVLAAEHVRELQAAWVEAHALSTRAWLAVHEPE